MYQHCFGCLYQRYRIVTEFIGNTARNPFSPTYIREFLLICPYHRIENLLRYEWFLFCCRTVWSLKLSERSSKSPIN
jgi:hypothetical protein